MITSTRRTKSRGTFRLRRAFTLIEVMAASSLSGIVLTGVMSSFVLLGQNCYNAANYSVMEAESRRALETFTREARMADNVTWNSAHSVTLSVPGSGTPYLVTYAYDSSTIGATARSFYRRLGDASSTSPRLVLVRQVSDFAFRRYKVINGVDFTAANDLETKQLQISLRTIRTGATTVNATNAVLSARTILRNKPVST